MLFLKEIEDLKDDGFEGSNDERRIFMDVFRGNEKDYTGKRCLVTGSINFEADSKHKNKLLHSDCENSPLTSQFSTKTLFVDESANASEDARHLKDYPCQIGRRIGESGCLQDTSASSVGLNSHDVNAKQMKGLFDELFVARDRISTESSPDVGSKTRIETRKELASCVSSRGSHCVGQIMTCQLVESSGQGVISSCYLLKQLHVDHGGEIDVPGASKCEVTTVLGRDCPYRVGRRTGESGYLQDSSTSSVGLNAHDVNAKQMNGSFNELSVVSDKISTEPLSEEGNNTQIQTANKVASCISSLNSHCAGQKMTCQLVQPSGKSATSSCLLKQRVDHGDDIVPGASKCEVSSVLDGTRDIESMPSPVSHESFRTKLSIADPSITARERSPKSEMDIVPQKIDSVKDLRPCLRSHVNYLLKAAGWCLSTRIRKDRNVLAPVYVSPEGERVRAFQKAWWSCGERFQADRYGLMQENHEKQWIGIDEFCSDLSDTLAKIEKEAHQKETCASLGRLWNTLNPFVTVVYIHKKIGALREGKIIKANRSALFISSNTVDTVSNEVVEGQAINQVHNLPHGSIPALGGAEIVSWGKDTVSAQSSNKDFSVHGEQNQGRAVKTLKGGSIYLTDAEGMVVGKSTAKGIRGQHFVTFGHQTDSLHPSSSPVCVSDFSCNHSDYQLYDVPITLGNIDRVFGKAGNVFCLQGRDLNVTSSNEESCGKKVGREFSTEGLSGECGMKKDTTLDKIGKKNLQGCLPDQLYHSISHCDSDNSAVQVDTCMHSAPLCSEFVEAMVERIPYNCNQKDVDESLPVLYQPSSVTENFELTSSQLSEQSAVEQQNLFLNPWGMFCHGALVHSEGKGHSQENMLETADRRSMHRENLSFVYRNPSREDHCVDEVEKERSNLDFSSCQEEPYLFQREVPTEGLKLSRHLGEESSKAVETTEVEMEHASLAETDVVALKKAPKKSKRISEIKSCIHHRELSLSTPEKVNSLNDQRLRTRSQFSESHKSQKGEASTDEGHKKSLFISSSQHQGPKKYRAKKLLHQCNDSQKIAVVTHGKKGRKKLHLDNGTSADTLPMKNGSEDSQYSSKIGKTRKSEFKDKNGRKRSRRCQIEDDDLLIAAIIKPKDFGSKQSSTGRKHYNSKSLRKFKSQSNNCKLLPRSPGKGGKHMDGKLLSVGKRTVLSWLIDTGVVSVNDVVQYRRQKDDAVVKDGWITRDGIRCKCCDKVLSVSEFKVHAGFKLYRPCLNLFMESGTPFTLCQLQAWSAEYKARKGGMRATQVDEVDQNDDTCGLCGDGGELICCDNCPSTFHQACFSAQELPEGSWYCPYCTCRICGSVVSDTEASSSFIVLKCSQCEHKYHCSCVQESDMHKEDIASGTWFCGENCKEVYTGLRSRVGILNHVADDFSWTLLKCIDGDQKIRSVQRCALMAECNSKLAVALRLMEECFLPMVDPRTGIDMIPHALYNWGL